MSINKPIQLGLCCLNITLKQQKPAVFASRTVRIKTVNERGFNILRDKIIYNLQDTLKMIEWNQQNGIKVFRLSSDLFPHKSNNKIDDYSFDFALDLLREIGEKAKQYNMRLTFHPGQYNVIGTLNKEYFNKTISDLKYHADVLDLMNMDNNSVIVVHGGGLYNNKQATIKRWCEQFKQLPQNVQDRLVLENCERSFSIRDCLNISLKLNIPVVFDTHHFECYKLLHPEESFQPPENYIPDILKTWSNRNIKPKFHVSEQGSGRVGHHSNYIETIPDYLLEIPDKYDVAIDIMIEAKMKELAIFKLYKQYPQLNCKINVKPKQYKLNIINKS